MKEGTITTSFFGDGKGLLGGFPYYCWPGNCRWTEPAIRQVLSFTLVMCVQHKWLHLGPVFFFCLFIYLFALFFISESGRSLHSWMMILVSGFMNCEWLVHSIGCPLTASLRQPTLAWLYLSYETYSSVIGGLLWVELCPSTTPILVLKP